MKKILLASAAVFALLGGAAHAADAISQNGLLNQGLVVNWAPTISNPKNSGTESSASNSASGQVNSFNSSGPKGLAQTQSIVQTSVTEYSGVGMAFAKIGSANNSGAYSSVSNSVSGSVNSASYAKTGH